MVKNHYTDSKVILSGMYNCNFEAISYVLNKRMEKTEMEYAPFACTIISYMILCVRFRKELLMLRLHQELLTFALDFFCYRSLHGQPRFKLFLLIAEGCF